MSLFQPKVGFVTQPRKADSFLEKQLTCALTCYTSTEAAPKGMGQPFKSYELILVSCYVLFFPHVTGHMPPFQALSRSNLMGFSSHPVFSIALLVGQNCMCLAVWGCFPLPTKKSCLQRSSYDSNKNKNQDSCHFFCRRSLKTYTFHC